MLARGFAGEFEKEICCDVAAVSFAAPVAAVSLATVGCGAVGLLATRTAGLAAFVDFCDVEVDLSGDLAVSLMVGFDGDSLVEEALEDTDLIDPDLARVPGVAAFLFALCLVGVGSSAGFFAGERSCSAPIAGSSPATCSIASSRASIASTESSIRGVGLDGDRAMIWSTNESDSSSRGSCDIGSLNGEAFWQVPTNESCSAPSAMMGVVCSLGSNLGVLVTAGVLLVGLLLRDRVASVTAALVGV